MSHKRAKTINPLLAWIAGNFLGIAVLSAMVFALPFLKSINGVVASVLIISIPIGLAQWLVLRRLIPLSPVWMLTIPAGFVLSFLIYSSIPDALRPIVDDEATLTLTIIYTAYGATIGLAQWVILRRHFARSSIWILGSSVGIGLGFGLVLATDLINQSGFISGIVVLLVYGIATGLILLWLLNHHIRSHALRSSAT